MKKTFLGLAGLATLALSAAAGFVGANNVAISHEVKANDSVTYDGPNNSESYVPFNEENFDAYDTNGNPIALTAAGSIVAKSATYWDGNGSFYALDSFFRGESNEPWKGTIKTFSWTQYTRYVMFMWGGRAEMTINFYKNDNTSIGSMTNDLSNGNPLMVNYYTIPDSIDDSTLASGVSMYLVLVDDYASDYGFNNFGYLHPNASLESISTAMWAQMDSLAYTSEERRFRAHYTMEHYNGNAKFDGIRELAARTNVNEDFESSETFQNNWFLDTNYDDGASDTRHIDTAISTIEHRQYDSAMPINKTGNGFFKGFYEAESTGSSTYTGYVGTDGARYRFVSRPFLLSGTGYVSIKMAGRSASLHVLRGTGRNSTDENEVEFDLAWINIQSFVLGGDEYNLSVSNKNTVTMVRHVINLSAFLGEIIQLAIADADTGGDWGAVNFDELITYYPNYPTFKVDTPVQNSTTGTFNNYYLDKYISGAHTGDAATGIDYRESAKQSTTDTGVVKEAATFLSSFYSLVRNRNNGVTHCGKSLDVSALKTSYEALSADAKTIVNASEDFNFGKNATSETWYTVTPEKGTVGVTCAALFNSGSGVYAFLTNNPANSGSFMIMTIIVLISVIGVAGLILYRRRKENN